MLPEEIVDIFRTCSEDDYSLSLTAVACDQAFHLDFQIRFPDRHGDDGYLLQTWTVEAEDYKQSAVYPGAADFLKITEDSPLLWAFTDTQGELYFTGKIKHPEKLWADLYQTHKKLFGNYQPFALPFIGHQLCSGHVPYSNGQVARGAKKLLEHYAACLKAHGLRYSIVGEWHPPERGNLQVLFLGDTYVIARRFSFQKKEDNGL